MNSKSANASTMRGRRGARRLAVQAIYQSLMAGGDAPALVNEFVRERAADDMDQTYFRELVTDVLNDRAALDALLQPELDRPADGIDPVEHAILLVGACELRDRSELAISIVINEAVELAKTFGADNGHRFVNGVLDHLAAGLRPDESKRREGGNRG
ncbi:MAG: transcription antitermination factor NusB [Gammaproteobacteria bacterium]